MESITALAYQMKSCLPVPFVGCFPVDDNLVMFLALWAVVFALMVKFK
jgi:hypothetical protein